MNNRASQREKVFDYNYPYEEENGTNESKDFEFLVEIDEKDVNKENKSEAANSSFGQQSYNRKSNIIKAPLAPYPGVEQEGPYRNHRQVYEIESREVSQTRPLNVLQELSGDE